MAYDVQINIARGRKIIMGKDGNGIESVVLNDDYTLTLNFTDGTSYTTDSIQGKKYELTEADKDELIERVLAALPAAEGGAY